MKLDIFVDSTGQRVAINPECVSKVIEKSEGVTLIKLEKDDFVEVQGDFVEVVYAIRR